METSTQIIPLNADYNDNTATWEENQQKIEDCIEELVMAGTKPSPTAIHEKTGLSRSTVYKHWEGIKNKPVEDDIAVICKSVQSKILLDIVKGALKGDKSDRKLYAQIMGLTGKARNNTINFSNTNLVMVNAFIAEVVKNLPPEKQAEFENILKLKK